MSPPLTFQVRNDSSCFLLRCIGELPDCCVIDPFDNIFPIVDRLRIQEILLGLADVKSKSQHKIRGAYFLKVSKHIKYFALYIYSFQHTMHDKLF